MWCQLRLIGQVMALAEEQVQLVSVLPIQVDMDWLKVVRVLRLTIDDEEE